MKKITIAAVCILALASCKKSFMEDQNGKFKVSGIQYETGEDNTSAAYNSSDEVQINMYAGANQSNQVSVVINLNIINDTVTIAPNQSGWYYVGDNSAVMYFPISGQWIITSHKEGNPATRHTEGNFQFTAVNQYDQTDTVKVTDGYFFVNNY